MDNMSALENEVSMLAGRTAFSVITSLKKQPPSNMKKNTRGRVLPTTQFALVSTSAGFANPRLRQLAGIYLAGGARCRLGRS